MSAETLTGILERLKDRIFEELRVAIPARVHTADNTRHIISAQPLIKTFDGESEPVINDIPVIYPRSSGFSLTFPLEKGDIVLLIFADRQIDDWFAGGGRNEAGVDIKRGHDLTDAFAIPLGSFETIPWDESSGDTLRLKAQTGRLAIGAKGVELIKALVDVIDVLLTEPDTGGYSYSASARLQALKAQLESIRGEL